MNRLSLFTLMAAALAACNPSEGRGTGRGDGGTGGDPDGGMVIFDPDGGVIYPDDAMKIVQDPTTCAEAEANKTYIGCDYWPTVTANAVWNIFDFAVVVSNPGAQAAMVTVTGPNGVNQTVSVAPGALEKIFLPWVPELKGGEVNECGSAPSLSASVLKAGGAYHLVSSSPVLVYQFNALEYKGAGGAAGKDWSQCVGTTTACPLEKGGDGKPVGCFSFSNDASLLLPSTAMTGNYRVMGHRGRAGSPGFPPILPPIPGIRSYISITATQNGTTVKVQVSGSGQIIAGTGVSAVASGGTTSLSMNAGDVAQLVTNDSKVDLSGSLVQADKPIQVIGGVPCIANPASACDHVEETIMPAETLGRRYAVSRPTGPRDTAVPATVRIVGNVDNTTLTFTPAVAGAPSTISAGQVVEIEDVDNDFVVEGDHEFLVATVMKSASVVDPLGGAMAKGDPSLSAAVAVDQFRLKYVFLAPNDYDLNYADVVAPVGTHLMLDGAAVSVNGAQIGASSYAVYRLKLSNAAGGAHTLTADQPCGLQVLGYGSFTSYQYPGGLNLLTIAAPPPPIS